MKLKKKKSKRQRRWLSRKGGKNTLKTKTKLNCSPKENKSEATAFSCYTKTELQKLRQLWNARHADVSITSTKPEEIHSFLSKQLSGLCENEACWLKQTKLFGSNVSGVGKDSFSPFMPEEWKKNPYQWLSSVDINNVMHQYERAYKCFEFIGPSPIDFDKKIVSNECVWKELCHFSLMKQMQKRKTKIGMIFNTDPHNESGEHWISMFINIRKGTIFFFDSVGATAPPEVQVLVARIIRQGQMLRPPIRFKYDENYPVEHQYKTSECGIYSLFFIIHLLEDKVSENYFKTHVLKDEYMHQFRNKFFNVSK
jgi:hypothetical protein